MLYCDGYMWLGYYAVLIGYYAALDRIPLIHTLGYCHMHAEILSH